MRITHWMLGFLVAGIILVPLASASGAWGQGFVGALSFSLGEGSAPATATPESNMYADGMRAIREGRWNDAEAIFANVAKEQGSHSEGALYWKAYAENKRGQSKTALETCVELRHNYPSSSWLDECGALEIEIRAKNNLPVQTHATESDDVRLLALNSLMKKNEPKALEQIEAILNGDSSERLKQGALFILGEHHDNVTYPQIVRLSYVEGDVRIARGVSNGHSSGAVWEKAVADLPLETGYSLVTGNGRAEIEFENASTIYLAENSVLTFNDLHTSTGVPFTQVALLSGTVTLDIKPFMANEVFLLETPTDNIVSRYPDRAQLRVDSYLDAMALTPLTSGVLRTPGAVQQPLVAGKTLYYLDGQRIEYAGARDSSSLATWDKWVAERIEEKFAATQEVMKAAGLPEPIPGLAGLQNQGTFFDCAPYGTCWEPNAAVLRQVAANAPALQSSSEPQSSEAVDSRNAGQFVAAAELGKETKFGEAKYGEAGRDAYLNYVYFPCTPEPGIQVISRDPATGKMKPVIAGNWPGEVSYAWAVCHSGNWIHHGNHYVWVVGHRRHHLPPYRWIRSGKEVAYVPVHPHDVKGQLPVNRKTEAFLLNDKDGLRFQRTVLDPNRPIELMKTPPKEFRDEPLRLLARADEPHPVARQLRDALVGKNVLARAGGVPISFDHRTQSFLMARSVMDGRKSATIIAPVNNHSGDLQAHAQSFAGGWHGGSPNIGGNGGGGLHVGTSVTSSTISTTSTTSTFNSAGTINTGAAASGMSMGTGTVSAGSHH
jgi:hypothetical protein